MCTKISLSKRRSFSKILNNKEKLSLLAKREYPNGGGSLTENTSKSFKLLRPDGHLLSSKLIFVHIFLFDSAMLYV